ncbi:MAG: hypothetical protein M1828_006390 [Chrysothrix sp. TS-e1954]|nr:MAG: hypothetical protein M1828_006390 [Chrysothrix sp. TS-e1954]
MGSKSQRAASTAAVSHDAQTDSELTPIPRAPQYSRRKNNRDSGRFHDDHDRDRQNFFQSGDGFFDSRDYGARDRVRRRQNSAKPKKKNYSYPPEKSTPPRRVTNKEVLVLSVFHSPVRGWRTEPVTFDPRHTTDQELWEDIRAAFRDDLEKWWRRVFLFKKLRYIVPIEYSSNDVPVRPDLKDFPDLHSFMHAFHHAHTLKSEHAWVDWFVEFKKDPNKQYGLEFKEQLWAEKLAAIAIFVTFAIIVTSVVWVVLGGDLQTVFTVMSFVLGGATGESPLRSDITQHLEELMADV